jgi:hypothetical protein
MKNLIFLLCFTLSFNSFAQGIDNNDSLDGQFNQTQQLTDQQNDEAQTFVHQGIKDKAIEKGCKDKLLKDCDPGYPDSMGVLLPGGIENQIGKLYTVIFGVMPMLSGNKGGSSSGASNTTTPPAGENGAANGATPPAGDAAKKTGKDYCIYIPMLYEGISFVTQMAGQKQAQQETANLDAQLAALAQLKEAHKTRKKTATQQSVVYGATAACYVATMFTPAPPPNGMIKGAAAGGISVLYMMKAKKHAKAAEAVQRVIDSLPKAGDCNPWTGTQCFCSEKTSPKLYPGQYQEVCVLNKGNPNGPLSNMGCAVQTNGQVALDANCSCKASNTCINSRISMGRTNLGLGANFINDANKGLSLLDPSQFDEGKLNDFQASMAAKLNDFKAKGDKTIPDVKLSPEQKALANELSKVVPPAVANLAAASPTGGPPVGGLMSGSTSSALDKVPAALQKDMKDFEVGGNYRKSGGFSPTASAAAEPGFTFPGMPGGQQQPQGGEQTAEDFAAKAVDRGADVRNTPDTAIFEIISNRYRMSAWKRLNAE